MFLDHALCTGLHLMGDKKTRGGSDTATSKYS
jgi:hypothetical protein